ncbi:hypothetical protein L486_05635 [Kwoniella mangroviensis CBS 10435]|uniref:Uncharacterized protein n=1 Tax=Kwoniella mangroviensis CBS 10435 TaxID=1331196 RepID=A0A1B9IN36_9TREE|nr:uncharacterized protein I203_07282 [Kwoniella mangroviensis CBS 8507]OCF56780.1 hypothetical protein L486_05635 [Kwoniella mangroviensis CBS 10435]OCF63584.1 hypothetical protein I203_07282 [Kwoniella mangroviensis CBS 8507]OCF75351.1 hypothetical protein I204_04206 [Kwoniella mangroviensis CBS 8886]
MTFTSFPSKTSPHDRWVSGCQAIFAGFVARATELKMQPTIRHFWSTDQSLLLLPSLRSMVHSQQQHQHPIQNDNDDTRASQDTILQNTLYLLLNSKQNKFTKFSSSTIQPSDVIDQEWELTKAGKQTFHLRPNPTTSIDLATHHKQFII